uniref:Uncharacterized protein n=1 Tax=Anguilla anguilla TaxID=7936 RepID=A0A0E9R930_ANGAN
MVFIPADLLATCFHVFFSFSVILYRSSESSSCAVILSMDYS